MNPYLASAASDAAAVVTAPRFSSMGRRSRHSLSSLQHARMVSSARGRKRPVSLDTQWRDRAHVTAGVRGLHRSRTQIQIVAARRGVA